jgi:hypothetical protein
MLNTDFDPYQALVNMDRNLQNVIAAHNLLAQRVEVQSKIIDTLIEAVKTSNNSNEIMLNELRSGVIDKLKEMK